jgi:hypothetical protein
MKVPKFACTAVLALFVTLLLTPGISLPQDQPSQPLVHFHHVHLNALNPELAMAWYTRH